MYLQYVQNGWQMEQYKRCCEHAETDDIIFICYGGSSQSERYAKKNGWLWVPEDMAVTRGKHAADAANPQGKRALAAVDDESEED